MRRIAPALVCSVVLTMVVAPIILSQTPDFLVAWGGEGSADGQFIYPGGVTTDPDGNVYVVDTGNHRVQKFTADGAFLMKWGNQGSGNGQFSFPLGVTLDAEGNVYIGDIEHGAVFVVGPDTPLTTLVQSKAVRWPDALSFGPDGYLYLADSALPDLILQSREHIKAAGPYRIYRFQPGFESGTPTWVKAFRHADLLDLAPKVADKLRTIVRPPPSGLQTFDYVVGVERHEVRQLACWNLDGL